MSRMGCGWFGLRGRGKGKKRKGRGNSWLEREEEGIGRVKVSQGERETRRGGKGELTTLSRSTSCELSSFAVYMHLFCYLTASLSNTFR